MTVDAPVEWLGNDITLEPFVDVRRHLHRHPELRFAEVRTASYLKALLEPIADRLTVGIGGTGLLAEIDGVLPGPRVLLRADMDAYPVEEQKGVPYRSENAGVAHACGHDAHMTVMYGAFERLAARRPERGSVHVLFQPAEETPFGQYSGAKTMLESGALRDDYVAVLGLHCWPQLEAGTIGIDDRISMAAKDGFKIVVTGTGAHAATPAFGRDAILAIAKLVSALHAILSRQRNPEEMVAFNIGTITGGASQSLVAPSAEVTGTLRTHDEQVRTRLKRTIEQVCAGAAMQQDVNVDLEWADAMPAVMNDPELVSLAVRSLAGVVDLERITMPPMTADDFALLAERWPGIYMKLGVARPGSTGWPSLHASSFDIDEECLRTGVRAIEVLTRTVLERNEGN